MNKNSIKVIPLSITTFILLFTLGEVVSGSYGLLEKHYVAIGLTLISWLIYYIKKDYSFFATGFMLLLGTFNFLAFTSEVLRKDIGVKLNNFYLGVSFQPFSLVLLIIWLIVFCYFYYLSIKKWFDNVS